MQAARLLILPTIVAPALGPVLGGLLVDRLSWRWIFFVNVPIGLAALLFGLLFLREHRETDPGAFDLPGFLLASSGFPLVMYALTEGSVHGWESPRICGTAVAGTLLLLAFVIVELRTPQPLVQLRLFGNRLFRTTTSVSVLASAGFLGILFLVPLFLQQARGASALSSGLTTFPEALGVLFSTQIVARLYPRVGPRRLMAGGMVGAAVCMSMLGFVGLTTNAWLVRVLMFLTGGCMAYVFLPTQAAAFTTVAPSATGRASTLFSAQRQLGAACGVALISSVLAVVGTTAVDAAGAVQPHLAAYRAGFFAAAAFALAAALLALAVPDAEAAASMRQPAPHDKSVREEALVAD